jgi:hypothetical protein
MRIILYIAYPKYVAQKIIQKGIDRREVIKVGRNKKYGGGL